MSKKRTNTGKNHRNDFAMACNALAMASRGSTTTLSQGESIITSAEALRGMRMNRYSPLRDISASRLAAILDAFAVGSLRDAALLWEQIAERDDTVSSVKPKREKSVSGLEVVYEAKEGRGQEGETQREILEKFWSTVRATDAYDRNEKGGLRLFIRQMMSSISYRYAVHHIVWSPRSHGLEATFEFVPLWLFENRTGRLRYLKTPTAMEGEEMRESEWLITSGDGLMIAVSIGWLAKRESYNDWLIFSSRFSIPGVLGRTRAAKGSAEGLAMRDAVLAFGREMKAVIYSDDGTIAKPIETIEAQGSPAGQPMPAIIERVDRKIATLYRGNDLSTMSAGSGEGSGASLQEKESDVLLKDDVALVNEQLARISKMVLEWHFGGDVEIHAEARLMMPNEEAAKLKTEVKADEISPDEEANTPPKEPRRNEPWQTLHELMLNGFSDVADAIKKAIAEPDGKARARALQEVISLLPDAIENPALEDALERLNWDALLGAEESEANGDFKGHPFRGNQWGKSREKRTKEEKDFFGVRLNKQMTPEQNFERLQRSIEWAVRNKTSVYGAAYRKELGVIDLPWGTPGDVSKDYIGGKGLSHILGKHPRDVKQIAEVISYGEISQSNKGIDKRNIRLGRSLVVCVKDKESKSWLLTSFEDEA